MTTLKGHFLIAVPELMDGNFLRSVVLVIQHNERGAMGLILNRPTNLTVGQAWEELFEVDCNCQDKIHVGGPVDGTLLMLHKRQEFSEITVMPGIFASMNGEHLKELVSENHQPFKIFAGYSGWGGGQLEREIEAGGWLTLPADEHSVYATPENLWKRVCEQFGSQVLHTQLGKSIPIPSDPSLN